jgi:type II secretory pathway pseudopilin PulG
MQNISKRFIVAIAVVIIAIVGGGWFWYASVQKDRAQVEQQQAEALQLQVKDIPQWEKDALVEREKLGYPALPEGWRLFRSDEYGFEVGYKKEWLGNDQDAGPALNFSDSKTAPRFFFVEIRPRSLHDKTMLDTALSLPKAQQGSVAIEDIRNNKNTVREKLLDIKTSLSKVGFLWLTEKGTRTGVVWNDVNGQDTFWASIISGNREYFFSGNALGQSSSAVDLDPHYDDFMVFLGSFRILN